MIKIELNQKIKDYIEENHYNDIVIRYKDAVRSLNNKNKLGDLKHFLFRGNNINYNNLQKIILGNKTELIEVIEDVGEITNNDFDKKLYSNFTNREWSNKLLTKLNVTVCPYCNRQYTFTLKKSDGIRPQFDHYFPQSKYPYLQVSLYNLIPSCSTCNMKKGDYSPFVNTKFDKSKAMFYPYKSSFEDDVIFTTSPSNDNNINYWLGIGTDFNIDLEVKGNLPDTKAHILKERVAVSDEQLKLKNLYNQHKDYVRDIIIKSNVYNQDKIDELLQTFPELFRSTSEVLNKILMSYTEREDWGKRPLSKLTHDIFREFSD